MFTGIVQGCVPLLGCDLQSGGAVRLVIELGEVGRGVDTGASVAVNGVCLTVVATDVGGVAGRTAFDVIPQTLRTTNLGGLQPGMPVNVERSFRVGDEVGGHILSGHVVGCVEVTAVTVEGDDWRVRMRVPEAWLPYVFEKGFVALDGASLTIAALDRRAGLLDVCLIPETLARTTFGDVAVGRRINIEVDGQTQAIVDTVTRLLADPDWRQQAGFAAG